MGLTTKPSASNTSLKKVQLSENDTVVIEGSPSQKRVEFSSLLALPALFTILFIVIPLVLMFLYSFWTVEGPNIVPKWTI